MSDQIASWDVEGFERMIAEFNAIQRMSYSIPTSVQGTLAWMSRYLQDPLVEQLLRAMALSRTQKIRFTEPWMAIAERRSWIGLLSDLNIPVRMYEGMPEEVKLASPQDRAQVGAMLGFAQTYLWKADVLQVATTTPIPPQTLHPTILPFPVTFHSWEDSFSLVAEQGGKERINSDWAAYSHTGRQKGVNVAWGGQDTKTDEITLLVGGIRYANYPEGYPEGPAAAGQLIALMGFLRSSYVSIDIGKVPRAFRRHPGASPITPEENEKSTVSVVTLRREAREAVEAYNAETRHFRHRWWVSAHYRKQWYPSTQSHEVVWIAPYLKGRPSDPMIERVYSVVR